MAQDRKLYVESLRRERDAIEQRGGDKAEARLAAIDAELKQFSDTPARRGRRETAVPNDGRPES